MINEESQNNESAKAARGISAESVLSYVVLGCFAVAVIGIFSGFNGVSLLASAVALGVIAYIYCHKH